MSAQADAHHVGLVGDPDFFTVSLSDLLAEAEIAACSFESAAHAAAALPNAQPPIDLVVLDLTAHGLDRADALGRLAHLVRRKRKLVCVDHLFSRTSPDLLEQSHVAHVLDKAASPATVLSDLSSLLADAPVRVERREDARTATWFAVEFESLDPKRARVGDGYCSSLARGGMYLRTNDPLTLGDVVVRFVLPDGATRCELAGSVVYFSKPGWQVGGVSAKSPPGMGIKLAPMSRRDRAALDSYLERAAAAPASDQEVIFGRAG